MVASGEHVLLAGAGAATTLGAAALAALLRCRSSRAAATTSPALRAAGLATRLRCGFAWRATAAFGSLPLLRLGTFAARLLALLLRLRAAALKTPGLEVPPGLSARADEVIRIAAR